MKLTRRLFVAAAVVAAAIAQSSVMAHAADGDVLRAALPAKFRTLNPAVQSGSATGLPGAQIYAGLVKIADDFSIKPWLAESWSISDDGLTYTFKIRTDATFHDGAPITSADVAFSLETSKSNHPFGKTMFGQVTGVESPDDMTVVIRLQNPVPALLQSLHVILVPILPKHILGDGQELKTHPRNMENIVGSGPYRVKTVEPGTYVHLIRNENYFVDGYPKFDEIEFSFESNNVATILKLETGELDFAPLTLMARADLDTLKGKEGLEVISGGHEALGAVRFLDFNLRDDLMKNVNVRKAIAYAINEKFLAEVLLRGVPAYSMIDPGSPFFFDGQTTYLADMAKAEALLDEAGFAKDASGRRFGFTLDLAGYAKGQMRIIGNYIQQELRKIGIEVEQRESPDFGSWSKRIAAFDYSVTINGIWGYPDPTIGVHRLFDCGNIKNQVWTNTAGFCDEQAQAMLDAASIEMDHEARVGQYAEFQKIISDQIPYYPIYNPGYNVVRSNKLKGLNVHGWGVLANWDALSF